MSDKWMVLAWPEAEGRFNSLPIETQNLLIKLAQELEQALKEDELLISKSIG